MKITATVIPNSKENQIIKNSGRSIKVKLKAPAKEGKANKELIKVLSDYFGVSKSNISIISGISSKTKVIEVLK